MRYEDQPQQSENVEIALFKQNGFEPTKNVHCTWDNCYFLKNRLSQLFLAIPTPRLAQLTVKLQNEDTFPAVGEYTLLPLNRSMVFAYEYGDIRPGLNSTVKSNTAKHLPISDTVHTSQSSFLPHDTNIEAFSNAYHKALGVARNVGKVERGDAQNVTRFAHSWSDQLVQMNASRHQISLYSKSFDWLTSITDFFENKYQDFTSQGGSDLQNFCIDVRDGKIEKQLFELYSTLTKIHNTTQPGNPGESHLDTFFNNEKLQPTYVQYSDLVVIRVKEESHPFYIDTKRLQYGLPWHSGTVRVLFAQFIQGSKEDFEDGEDCLRDAIQNKYISFMKKLNVLIEEQRTDERKLLLKIEVCRQSIGYIRDLLIDMNSVPTHEQALYQNSAIIRANYIAQIFNNNYGSIFTV